MLSPLMKIRSGVFGKETPGRSDRKITKSEGRMI
jgi:hypothetical protein